MRNVSGIEYPDGWHATGSPTDWSLMCDDHIVVQGTARAVVYMCCEDGPWFDAHFTMDMMEEELLLLAAINGGICDEDCDRWTAECPQDTRLRLGWSGALAFLVAHDVGGAIECDGASWPPAVPMDAVRLEALNRLIQQTCNETCNETCQTVRSGGEWSDEFTQLDTIRGLEYARKSLVGDTSLTDSETKDAHRALEHIIRCRSNLLDADLQTHERSELEATIDLCKALMPIGRAP